jgi:hypothetical protein
MRGLLVVLVLVGGLVFSQEGPRDEVYPPGGEDEPTVIGTTPENMGLELEAALTAHYDFPRPNTRWGQADYGPTTDFTEKLFGSATVIPGIDKWGAWEGGSTYLDGDNLFPSSPPSYGYADYDTVDAVSISIWCQALSVTGGVGTVGWFYSERGSGGAIGLSSRLGFGFYNTAGNLRLAMMVSDGATYSLTLDTLQNFDGGFPTGTTWHHFVGTWDKSDGGQPLTYIDGALAGNTSDGASGPVVGNLYTWIGSGEGSGIFGNHQGAALTATAKVDELSIFDIKLTLAQVQWLYNNGNGVPRPWDKAK